MTQANAPSGRADEAPPTVLPSDDRHRLRSQLQTVRVGMALIEKLLELGRHEEARETCNKVADSIDKLAHDPSLNPPDE